MTNPQKMNDAAVQQIVDRLEAGMMSAASAFEKLGRSLRDWDKEGGYDLLSDLVHEIESHARIADRGLLPELLERRKTDPDIGYLDVVADREERGVTLRPLDAPAWSMGGRAAFVYEHYMRPDERYILYEDDTQMVLMAALELAQAVMDGMIPSFEEASAARAGR